MAEAARAAGRDPGSVALVAVSKQQSDERVDAILVSTFPATSTGQRGSSWLRRDLVGRLEREAKVPVEHVVVEPSEVGVGVEA